MAKSFILRYGNVGAKMCPVIAEVAGLDVFVTGDALPRDAEYCFRWGTTAGINNDAQKVVNKISAIHTTCDKAAFREKLSQAGLAPLTVRSIEGFRKQEFFPALIRPAYHERSNGMYLAKDAWEFMDAYNKVGRDFYASQFIQKEREFRVMVVQNRVAWVIEKFPKDKEALSWGCVQDGEFEYVGWEDWPIAVVDNALKSFALSPLDFGAIDIITDKEGRAYTLEINTAPFLTPYYARKIGQCFKWIVEKGRDHFPAVDVKTYKDAIHPAAMEKL